MLFSLPEMVSDKKIRVDFDSPDISSNGGLVLIGNMQNSLAWKIGQLIPDSRKKEFIHHTYMEMVSQRIGQILCGYEDANDCNQLRGDSALKMSAGRSITAEQFAHRMILRQAMLRHGFKAIDSEWWHFTLKDEPFPDTYFTFPVKQL